mgnify:CR=1 FL=1
MFRLFPTTVTSISHNALMKLPYLNLGGGFAIKYLDDDNEYVVVSKTNYNNIEYYYILSTKESGFIEKSSI